MRDYLPARGVIKTMTEVAVPNPSRGAGADALVEQLVTQFSSSLYRQARSIVRDHALAEDVVQDTLVQAWLAYETYRGEGSLKAWVMRIGHNVAVSTLRRRREEAMEPSLLPDTRIPGSENMVTDRMAVEAVWEALDGVTELSRAIIVLRDIEGFSYEEISEITGVSLATVKTRLFRTRRHLADSLEGWK